MKATRYILTVFLMGFLLGFSGAVFAQATSYSQNQEVEKTNVDRWPWAWGTECPFPWNQIDGTWVVQSIDQSGPNHGHSLRITSGSRGSSASKFLSVEHFDKRGKLVAAGSSTGRSSKSDRVMDVGLVRLQSPYTSYKVLLRSYLLKTEILSGAAPDYNTCSSQKTVMTVTFCPLRGRKCLEDSNYLLDNATN